MIKKITLTAITLFFSFHLLQGQNFHFIKNEGQLPEKVLYYTELSNGFAYFEKDRITYKLISPQRHKCANHNCSHKDIRQAHAFEQIFKNAKQAKIKAEAETPTKYHFFLGKEPKYWASNVSSFEELTYYNLYEGIDLHFYTNESGQLKYDFLLSPGTSPSLIEVKYEHIESRLDPNGNLHLINNASPFKIRAPFSFQEDDVKIEIPSLFTLKDGTVRYQFPRGFNSEMELVIDPTLIFSTFSGSRSDNFGYAATYDDFGNLYGSGIAFGPDYPTTFGAFDVSFDEIHDISLSKFSSDGRTLMYSAYFGGTGSDDPHSMIVNAKNELCVFGTTTSDNIPVTLNALFKTKQGDAPESEQDNEDDFDDDTFIDEPYYYTRDIVFFRVSEDGSQLLTSSYFGGFGDDGINSLTDGMGESYRGEIDIDKDGEVYIATSTQSNDPLRIDETNDSVFYNSWDYTHKGMLLKLSPNMDTLRYVHICPDSSSAFYSVAFDSLENAVVGGTISRLQAEYSLPNPHAEGEWPRDGYLLKLDKNQDSTLSSAVFGSEFAEYISMIDTDNEGNVYAVGIARSEWGTENNFDGKPMFITKITAALDSVEWKRAYGINGENDDLRYPTVSAFMVDYCGRIYLSSFGEVHEMDLPLTPDALYSNDPGGGGNFHLMVLNPDASETLYGTYFGGSNYDHTDGGTSRFDKRGIVYQTVCSCTDGIGIGAGFPTTPGAYSVLRNERCNMACYKLDFEQPLLIADFEIDVTSCENRTIQTKNLSSFPDGATFRWNFGDGTSSNEESPAKTYTEYGDYAVQLIVENPRICNLIDSMTMFISVREKVHFYLDSIVECIPDSMIGIRDSDGIGNYRWQPSFNLNNHLISNPTTNVKRPTDYVMYAGFGSCIDTFHQYVDLTGDLDSIGFYAEDSILIRGGTTVLHIEDRDIPTYILNEGEVVDSNVITFITFPIQYDEYYILRTYSLEDSNCYIENYAFIELLDIPCNEYQIQMGNALTPNDDGLNDELIVQTEILETYKLEIFDRWGDQVFETEDLQEHWDAKIDGKILPQGVYMYVLNGTCFEHPERGIQSIRKSGDITLIR